MSRAIVSLRARHEGQLSILRAVTSLGWARLPGDICGAQLSCVSIPFSLLSFSTLTETLACERFVTQKDNTYVFAKLHV